MGHGVSSCSPECASNAAGRCQGASTTSKAEESQEGLEAFHAEDFNAEYTGTRQPAARQEPPTMHIATASVAIKPAQVEMPVDVRPASPAAPPKDIRMQQATESEPLQQWGPRLDESQVLDAAWWWLYCCCFCGCGQSKELRPLELLCKVCCLQHLFRSADCQGAPEGICSCIHSCCGCTALCLLPPNEGYPRCLVCSQRCCGTVYTRRNMRLQWVAYEEFFNASIPCYCWCCGLAVVPLFCPDCTAKCCCCSCKCATDLQDPLNICRGLANCWCCLAQCRCLPHLERNPLCACCGWRLRKLRR